MKALFSIFLLVCLLLCLTCTADRLPPSVVEDNAPASVTIRVAGDFVIHSGVFNSAIKAGGGTPDFSEMLSPVAFYLSQADFTVTNVDGIMGTDEFIKKHPYSGYPAFSTPRQLISNLKSCGVDMMTLANNHALDYYFDGLKSSISSMRSAGMPYIGGYLSNEDKLTPRVFDINGITFGFLNYTDNLNQMDKVSSLDPDALKYGVDFWPKVDIDADIARLRQAGAEIIVCFMHWGIEYQTQPGQSQVNKAQRLADAGVDVIIGGHPHVVQKAEYVTSKTTGRKVLCLYSLGNFLSDQRKDGKDSGLIFDFAVTRDENGNITVSDPCYVVTHVWRRANAGGGYTYSVVFSDAEAPYSGMTKNEYQYMIDEARKIENRMNAGCAKKRTVDSSQTVTPTR
ncbi:MAG: CapA family protein [Clostridia bacterium]|nr:CapA family protein [Clostridia bacterium]